jgi:hypothetical protein
MLRHRGQSEAGRELDGRTFDDMPERKPGKATGKLARLALIEEVKKWEGEYGPDDQPGAEAAHGPDRQSLLF